MSAPRLATIPFEHVEAELAAFPIASEVSFRSGITSLNPFVSKNDQLWGDAEKHVLNTLPSIPPDETVAIRDKLWFNSSNPDLEISKSVSLFEYVRRLAESYLDSNGRPIQDPSETDFHHGYVGPEARLRWSWLCRALPPDFLRVVRGVIDPDTHQFPLHPVIQQLLQDQGFAETHLHLGASPDFSIAWASLMWGLTKNESRHSDFDNFGADFDHGRDLGTWVLYAAVVRLLLAQKLFDDSSSGASVKDLLQYACERHKNRLDIIDCNRLATLLSEFTQGKWSEFQESQIGIKPEEQLAKRFARTRALFRRLIESPNILRNRHTESQELRALQNPECRADIYLNDPISRVVGWQPTEAVSPETLFVAKALKYIKRNENSDFTTLFWQVIRIRCLVYRHVVQRPLTPGLQWFVRFFSRIKPVRKNIPESVLASTAARVCGKEIGLRSLEVRLGTEESVTECLMKVRNIEKSVHPLDQYAGWRSAQILNKEQFDALNKVREEAGKFEVGVVFHFSRKRGGGWEQGKLNAFGLDNSYPGKASSGKGSKKKPLKNAGNPSGFRFARFYMEQRRHAQALVSLFQKYPLSLRTVRGFDLCTDEAGVPVWVMAPLIRWVREAGQQAATQLKRRGEFNIPPTRLSVHAGEDFIHLLSGLRRLDETLTYLKLEEGDRLGHALALGIDPSIWCRRAGRVVITREERLFDLVWEWSRYAKHNIGVSSERLAYVRTEIVRLAKCIFKKSYAPEELMDFVDLLHNEQKLREEGFPDKSAIRTYNSDQHSESEQDKSKGLLNTFLRDQDVWCRGRVSETIDLRNIKHEEASLCQIQDGLRRKVGKLCLTIEVNPSSNLLIGDLGNFVGHPLWRLKPVLPVDDTSPLSICIGSDDPLTFATTLPHEYQLLFDALILMGHSHDEAMKWLNATREAGMQSRFTLPPNVTQLSEELRLPNLLGWERPQSPP